VTAIDPRPVKLVRRHSNGREGRGGLAVKEAEILGQFTGNDVAQADIIDQHDQFDRAGRINGGNSHRHITGDDGNLALEIDSKILGRKPDRITRTQKRV
jgi:hypothetical protein